MNEYRTASRALPALLALAVVACQGLDAPVRPGAGAAAAAVRTPGGAAQDPALTPAEAFRAWAYSLPVETVMPAMTGTIRYEMKGDIAAFDQNAAAGLPPDSDTSMSMRMTGELRMESWKRLRAEMDLSMRIGPLLAQDERPLELALVLVADGSTVWIEPDWSRAWFLQELEGKATGFERLVFTIQADTLHDFLDAAAGAMQGEAAEWYRKGLECVSNPACLARLLSDSLEVESFARRGDRVVADLVMDMSQWMDPAMVEGPFPMPGFSGPLRYRSEFDAASGAVLFTSYRLKIDEGALEMDFLQSMEIAREPMPAEVFAYVLPEGRQAFPLDLFMQPILAAIRAETGQGPPVRGEEDLPF